MNFQSIKKYIMLIQNSLNFGCGPGDIVPRDPLFILKSPRWDSQLNSYPKNNAWSL